MEKLGTIFTEISNYYSSRVAPKSTSLDTKKLRGIVLS